MMGDTLRKFMSDGEFRLIILGKLKTQRHRQDDNRSVKRIRWWKKPEEQIENPRKKVHPFLRLLFINVYLFKTSS